MWRIPIFIDVRMVWFYCFVRFFRAKPSTTRLLLAVVEMTKQRFVIDEFCSNRSNVA